MILSLTVRYYKGPSDMFILDFYLRTYNLYFLDTGTLSHQSTLFRSFEKVRSSTYQNVELIFALSKGIIHSVPFLSQRPFTCYLDQKLRLRFYGHTHNTTPGPTQFIGETRSQNSDHLTLETRIQDFNTPSRF